MAEGGFESGQGGVAEIPGGPALDCYPTGRGERRDGASEPDAPYSRNLAARLGNSDASVDCPTLGTERGSLDGYANETRTMP
jgi:hypothetical protein